ncbi:MAG TPA: TetR/AcrR family transcriptional regulator [Chryseolinea sp.]|nr:TetR/AcrR family transcriptional regulator [Chryseolinea sp.]
MYKTLSPKSTVQERKLLFDASMHLISNGRFLNATMQEIAFQARMSEATVAYIFENRTQLLAELIEYTAGNIYGVIDDTTRLSIRPFKDRFFDLWSRLHQCYATTHGMPAFLQQFDVLSKNARSLTLYPGYAPRLVDFFRSAPSGLIDVSDGETVAYMFHENVLTAAQMKTRAAGMSDDINLHMPEMLWKYLAIQ